MEYNLRERVISWYASWKHLEVMNQLDSSHNWNFEQEFSSTMVYLPIRTIPLIKTGPGWWNTTSESASSHGMLPGNI